MTIEKLEETNKIAERYLFLKRKADSGKKKDIDDFKIYQNYCAKKLSYLINNKTSRYKKFSNYQDLQQDGFEALIHAFETYDPKKGDFTWWASKYIGTRISRSANCHSTIKIPLKKARKLPPFKDSKIPNIIDEKNIPDLGVEVAQTNYILMSAIEELPEQHKKALLLHYDFSGNNKSSISSLSRELMVSRPVCIKILSEATEKLKEKLQGKL